MCDFPYFLQNREKDVLAYLCVTSLQTHDEITTSGKEIAWKRGFETLLKIENRLQLAHV